LMNLEEVKFASLLTREEPPLINIGTGVDLSIRELAELICRVVRFEGELKFDPTQPDGTPRKLCDVSKINALGWHAKTNLEDGIRRTLELAKKVFAVAAV
jgi:GDP-L-fucose synthase